jgi:PEP-CTERM motif
MTKLNSGITALTVLAVTVLLLPATSIAATVPIGPVPVPEPSSLPMLIAGLAGLGGFGWSFRRSGK